MSRNNSSSTSGGGVGFATLLGLLFIGLKLGHVIDWSWWWVLAPFWAGLALFAAAMVVLALIAGFAAIGVAIADSRKEKVREARLSARLAERRRQPGAWGD